MPPIAATAAAVVVIAIAGSVGYVVGGLGPDDPTWDSGNCTGLPTPTPMPAMPATAALAPTARVETVVVEKHGGGPDRKSCGDGDCGQVGHSR